MPRDVSTKQGHTFRPERVTLNTDYRLGITIRDDMTLQNCISGVTNLIENHSCSMILPLLDTMYLRIRQKDDNVVAHRL